MHILVVYAHPSPKSFNRSLLEVVVDEAQAKGHECVVHDLYAQAFQSALTDADFESFNRGKIPDDIKAEQMAVKRADVVVFMHPVWWFGLPAIFKGWIDRVFSYGFAYGHDSRGVRPLLAGKKAIIVNTAGGADGQSFQETGFKDAMIKLIDNGIFQFVGFDIILRRMFFQVPSASDGDRREMLEMLRSDLRKML